MIISEWVVVLYGGGCTLAGCIAGMLMEHWRRWYQDRDDY